MLITEILDIPNNALIDQFIPKQALFEEANSKKSDKELFTKYVKQMRIIYQLNEESIRIKPYLADDRSYYEIEVISIILKDENFTKLDNNGFKEDNKLNRIADILFRFIPNPMILSFEINNKLKLFVSHIKDSLTDNEKITLEGMINTEWIDLSSLDEIDNKLVDDLKLDNLDFKNVYSFYDDVISAILKYIGSKEVGSEVNRESDKILEVMNEIDEIDKEIAKLKREIKKESNFNKRLECNIKIHYLNDKLSELQSRLIRS